MMKIKNIKYVLFIAAFLLSASVKAQQDPQFTHYMYNMNVINPAYATDNEGVINLGGIYRTQWVGAVGAPKTASVFAHAPIAKNVEMGLAFVNDNIGDVVKENNINADFAYVLPISNSTKISFGVKGGVTFFDTDFSGFRYTDVQADPAFEQNITKTFPTVGAGTFLFSDKYYIGLSVPNMLKTKYIEKDGFRSTGVEEMHFYLTGGYVFDLSPNLKFKPAFMAKGVNGAPLSLDVTANVLFNNFIEGGLAYRLDDSVAGLVNFYITPNLRVGYSYDYTLSRFQRYNSGTHEIFVLFDLDLSNLKSKGYDKSPRFF